MKITHILSAAAVLVVLSCSRISEPSELPHNAGITLETAGECATRTYLGYSEGVGYIPYWLSTDAVKVFPDTYATEGSVLSNTCESGAKAVFKGTMSLYAGAHTFYAFYPSSAHSSGSQSEVSQTFKTMQGASNGNIDPEADILVSEQTKIIFSPANPTVSLNQVRFARKVSLLKLTFSDNTTGESLSSESILSVSVKAAGCTLSGKSLYNPSTDVVSWSEGRDSVCVSYEPGNLHFGPGNASLACVAPGQIPAGTELTFRILTEKHTVLKKVTVREEGISLPEGKLAVVNLSVGDENVTSRKAPMTAALLRATSSTLCVAWSCDTANSGKIRTVIASESGMDYTADLSKSYRVAVYRDEACSDLVVSWDVASTEGTETIYTANYPPRFCFSGLNPDTDYWFTVDNTSDGQSLDAPLKLHTESEAYEGDVVTSDAKEGDVILFENFDKLIYAGDLTAFAAGYSRTDRGSLTEPAIASGENPKGTDSKYYIVKGSTEIGLFNTLNGVLDDFGLADWCLTSETGVNSAVCARPGYVKVGLTSVRAALVTPQLSALTSPSMVKVTFKACPYGGTTIDEGEKSIALRVLDGGSISSGHLLTGATTGCVQALTLDGDQTSWKEYSIFLSGVGPTSRIAFDGNRGTKVTNRFMIDDIRVELSKADCSTFGYVYDTDGRTGVGGVWVNDGYSFTQSAADGSWELPFHSGVEFISYTLPATRQAVVSGGYPSFWQKYSASRRQYDFTLGTAIGKQTQWDLVVMADPQTHEGSGYSLTLPRFRNQVAPDIKAYVPSYASGPDGLAYGMVLGDISWNSGLSHATSMRDAMKSDYTGVCWFTVPGNHDWYVSNEDSNPSDANYKSLYGPTRYSFDRGDVHIVGMNDVIPTGTGGESEGGFTDDEYNWLVADLANVPKSKCVILCCHIGLYPKKATGNHIPEVFNALSAFRNAFVFVGHSHYNRRYPSSDTMGTYGYVMEHIHSAAFGNLWRLKLCPDGTPAGYFIYRFNGSEFSDIKYKAIGHDDSCQAKLYWGGDSATGTNVSPYSFGGAGYESYIFANVFISHNEKASKQNPSSRWSVELFQDGVSCGTMSRITTSSYSSASAYMYGCHPKPTIKYSSCPLYNYVVTSYDGTENCIRNDLDYGYLYWAMDKRTSIIDRSGGTWGGQPTNSSYTATCYHMWCGKLHTPLTSSNFQSADIKIIATNPYGKKFEVKGITKIGTDLSDANWGK